MALSGDAPAVSTIAQRQPKSKGVVPPGKKKVTPEVELDTVDYSNVGLVNDHEIEFHEDDMNDPTLLAELALIHGEHGGDSVIDESPSKAQLETMIAGESKGCVPIFLSLKLTTMCYYSCISLPILSPS